MPPAWSIARVTRCSNMALATVAVCPSRNGEPSGAEIVGRFDPLSGEILKAAVDREHGERQEKVRKSDNKSEPAEEKERERPVDHPKPFQRGVHDTVLTENRLPGVDADEVAAEQCHQEKKDNGILSSA